MNKPNPLQTCFELWISSGNSPLRYREFREEYSKFIFVVRILRQYRKSNTANFRLLLNHTIILYNVFGPTITPLFFLIADEELWPALVSVLESLYRIPFDRKLMIDGYEIDLSGLNRDEAVKQVIENL